MKNKPFNIEDLEKMNIFKVPDGYFEELPVRLEIEISLQNLNKKTSFKTPENYFETLADKIQNRIAKEQKQPILLENLPKMNVFKVKNYYFEKLSTEIQRKISPKKQNVFKVSWGIQRTFAAAASVILVTFGAWFFVAKQQNTDPEIALKNISNQEIISYLNDQDLSELDYSQQPVLKNITTKNGADSLIIKALHLNKTDILKHLENENVEEEI